MGSMSSEMLGSHPNREQQLKGGKQVTRRTILTCEPRQRLYCFQPLGHRIRLWGLLLQWCLCRFELVGSYLPNGSTAAGQRVVKVYGNLGLVKRAVCYMILEFLRILLAFKLIQINICWRPPSLQCQKALN